MEVSDSLSGVKVRVRSRFRAVLVRGLSYVAIVVCILSIFHSSLLISSRALSAREKDLVDRPIAILESRGFSREVLLLRHFTVYRSTDNWLNSLVQKDRAYAATNFPLNIVTLYPDYFEKTIDDSERAMVLLHEVRHLQGGDEHDAYKFAWQQRARLDWTLLTHGTSETYISTEQSTREAAPELFTCPERLSFDCTEILRQPETVSH